MPKLTSIITVVIHDPTITWYESFIIEQSDIYIYQSLLLLISPSSRHRPLISHTYKFMTSHRNSNGAEKKMTQNVCTHITFKRIELECPGQVWSGL